MNRMSSDLRTKLDSIDWSSMNVTRGSAEIVPELILKLDSDDMTVALKAACALDDNLCHQHVQIREAAVPAVPFLADALQRTKHPFVADELLGVFTGLARAVAAKSWWDGQRPDFIPALETALEEHMALFRSLETHADANVAEAATTLIEIFETRLAD